MRAALGDRDHSGPGRVVDSWRDGANRIIRLRAVPARKVADHGLTRRTVRRVTQIAPRQHESGTSYKYETYATQWRCGWWSCTKVREQMIRVVVNNRVMNDGRFYGVVTAYCPPIQGQCPSWVNEHIN